jgi:hypothetical protein
MLDPVVIDQFSGLDLRADPEQSACVDLLNVQLEQGYLRSREGYTELLAVASGSRIFRIGNHTDGSILFVDENADMNSVNLTTGVRTTVTANLTNDSGPYVSFGGTGGQRTYYGYGDASTQFSRITEGPVAITPTITNPGSTDNSVFGVCLAVSPNDNRLVWCSGHRVYFSGAGTPETFGANDYVDVDPGDGEYITAALSWRDLVFVFKESKYFVFYGTSTSSTGTPVFNYRKVRTKGATFQHGACAGPDAVYFHSDDGIYMTTGGEPTCISRELDPLWNRSPVPAAFQGSAMDYVTDMDAGGGLAWYRGRLYVSVSMDGTDTPTDMLVWTPGLGWSLWDVAGYSPLAATGERALVFAYAAGAKQIGKFDLFSQATDAGTAIVSRYRSGFGDLGSPGVEKTVRETELTGIGSPSFAWSRDFGSLDTAVAVTLGTSPATARGRHRVAKRGSVLSWQVSAASGAWRLNRVVPFVRDVSGAGSKTS